MKTKPIVISMTTFAGFVAADARGQLAKAQEAVRRYERPYRPGEDYWSYWRDDVERLHAAGLPRSNLATVGSRAPDERSEPYLSATDGYRRFWGRKAIQFRGRPQRHIWSHDDLQVRINPEWQISINATEYVVKLHLTRSLKLNRRTAQPLLHLLREHYPDDLRVAVLDVHRGELFTEPIPPRLGQVLQVQAAAFTAAWRLLTSGQAA